MSKSLMTPSLSGRIAMMLAGVRPTMRFASAPIASGAPVRRSFATTDGSAMTIPRPRTCTRVLAVPRSMPMSRENRPNRPSNKLGDTPSKRGAAFTRRITAQSLRTRAVLWPGRRCRHGRGPGRAGGTRARRNAGARARCDAAGWPRRRSQRRAHRAAGRRGPRGWRRRGRPRDESHLARAREARETDRLITVVVDDDAVDDARRRLLIDPHERVLGVGPRFEDPDVTGALGIAADREVHRVARPQLALR